METKGEKEKEGEALDRAAAHASASHRIFWSAVTTPILSLKTSDTVELGSIVKKHGQLVFCAKSDIFTLRFY